MDDSEGSKRLQNVYSARVLVWWARGRNTIEPSDTDRGQYSAGSSVVMLTAMPPTLVAQRWFTRPEAVERRTQPG